MPYSIETKDGIVINNIPDDIAPDDQRLKDRVAQERANLVAQSPEAIAQQSDVALEDALPGAAGGGELEPIVIPEPAPQTTIGEDIIGAGEAALTLATGATGGLAGTIGGTVKGIAEQVLSGEFGTQEAARAIQEQAQKGAQALTFAPRTQAGQQQVKAIGDVLSELPPAIPAAAPIAAITTGVKPVLGAITNKALKSTVNAWKAGGFGKAKIAEKIAANPNDLQIAKYIKKGSGRIVDDPLVKEAGAQGWDESIIHAVKGSTGLDKKRMKSMINIHKGGMKDAKFKNVFRPTDAVGDSVVARVTHVTSENKKSVGRLTKAAEKLKTETVDHRPAMAKFKTELDQAGVSLEVNNKGRIVPNFDAADFQGDATAERIIKQMVKRLDKTRLSSAYDVHRAKRFIDTQVSFGKKSREGLSGQAEAIVKKLRHDLDGALDAKFPAYKEANQSYGITRDAIDSLQSAVGKSIPLTGRGANKALGTSMRGLLSNNKSRVALENSLKSLDDAVVKTGGKIDDDVLMQALFADEIDNMFGAVARTSLKGQSEQAAKSVIAGRGRTIADLAVETAAKVADKARGINEENAIKAIEKLLKEAGK